MLFLRRQLIMAKPLKKAFAAIRTKNRETSGGNRERTAHGPWPQGPSGGRRSLRPRRSAMGHAHCHFFWRGTAASRAGNLGISNHASSVGCRGSFRAAVPAHSVGHRAGCSDHVDRHSCGNAGGACISAERPPVRGDRRGGRTAHSADCGSAFVEKFAGRFYTFSSLRYHQASTGSAIGALPEGAGIVLDDVAAGICALTVVHLLLRFGLLIS